MGGTKLIQFLTQINRTVTLKSVEFPLEAKQISIGQNRRKGRSPKHLENKMKIIFYVLLSLIVILQLNDVQEV
jgi:hypothetical protein